MLSTIPDASILGTGSYKEVLATFLHELAHFAHLGHGPDFYNVFGALVREVRGERGAGDQFLRLSTTLDFRAPSRFVHDSFAAANLSNCLLRPRHRALNTTTTEHTCKSAKHLQNVH